MRSRRVDAAAALNAALARPMGAGVAPVVVAERPTVRG